MARGARAALRALAPAAGHAACRRCDRVDRARDCVGSRSRRSSSYARCSRIDARPCRRRGNAAPAAARVLLDELARRAPAYVHRARHRRCRDRAARDRRSCSRRCRAAALLVDEPALASRGAAARARPRAAPRWLARACSSVACVAVLLAGRRRSSHAGSISRAKPHAMRGRSRPASWAGPAYARLLVRMAGCGLRTPRLAAPRALDARISAILAARARPGLDTCIASRSCVGRAVASAARVPRRRTAVMSRATYTPELAAALLASHPEADLDGDGVLSARRSVRAASGVARVITTS